MKIKSLILAFLLFFAVSAAYSVENTQHRLAQVVLDAINVSYIVIENDSRVDVITYGYKDAPETCVFLLSKGVNVISVENYNIHTKDKTVLTTTKTC